MRLRTQFLLGAAILIVVLMATAVLAVVTRVQVTRVGAQHEIATSLKDEANDLACLSGNHLLCREDAQKARWDAVFVSMSDDLERLEALGSDDSAIVTRLREDVVRLHAVFADVVATLASADGVSENQAFMRVSWSRLEVQNRQIAFDAARLEDRLERRAQRAVSVSTVMGFVMIGVFGVVFLAAYAFMYRRTIAGLAVLRSGAESVGRGNLDHLIPVERSNEIGDLSLAFNTMTIDLKNVTATKAKLESEVAERKKAQREMARLLAERSSPFERLQTSLIHVPQELPGVRFSHPYRSATGKALVGGDFYNVFPAKGGRIGLLIGDVSGHGIEAARTSTLVKDTVNAFAHQSSRPHHVLRDANRLLVESSLPGFVTAFLAFLDPESGALTYSSAGHPPPLLASDGSPLDVDFFRLPLGIMPDAQYADTEALCPTGSVLVLYTDGITEARRRGRLFGEEGLRRALANAAGTSLEESPDHLLEEALLFSRGHLDDDVALLVVDYLGPEAPRDI